MLKLQQMKKQQQDAKAAAAAKPAETGTGGYVLKKQTSKELAEVRKQKSKESLFSLRDASKSGATSRVVAAELRAQKVLGVDRRMFPKWKSPTAARSTFLTRITSCPSNFLSFRERVSGRKPSTRFL